MSSIGTCTRMSSRSSGIDDGDLVPRPRRLAVDCSCRSFRCRASARSGRPRPSCGPWAFLFAPGAAFAPARHPETVPLRRGACVCGLGRGGRPMRWTSSSGRCVRQAVRAVLYRALERQREVRAALGRDERVDLVDDHRLDRAQPLAGIRGEHQIQRLGRGDQDVAGIAQEPSRVGGWRVAGRIAVACRVDALCAATLAMPGQRRAQVALDVDASALSGEMTRRRAAIRAAPRTSSVQDTREMRRASCRSRSAPRISVDSPPRWRATEPLRSRRRGKRRSNHVGSW